MTYELDCLRVTAFRVTAVVVCCGTSALSLQLYDLHWCVMTNYEINCLRVTAFSVTGNYKCVTTSIVN